MDFELLTRLTSTFGPSGHEAAIRDLIRREVEPFGGEISVTPLGSLIVHRPGSGPRLMLAAHMDEIGVMVSYVEEKGFLRLAPIGGVFPLYAVGQRVRFANGVEGFIEVEHRKDGSKVPSLDELYIDVGATSRESCPVGVGDAAVFVGPAARVGDRIIGKTMDDRIGCYVLIELLRRLEGSRYDLYVVFTTQEEITLSGARTAAFGIEPEMAIAVDVTLTGDTPKALPMAVELGKGPAIKVKDRGMVAHPRVREAMVEAAEKAGLPYQMEILAFGTTDAAVMQIVRSGVPSGCLSIPCRHVHSPGEIVDVNDVEQSVELLLALVG